MKSNCIVCNNTLKIFGPRLNYEYRICDFCETLQLFPMPDENSMEINYRDNYSSAKQTKEASDPEIWKDGGSAYRKDILYALNLHNISGYIYDFGSGWGHLCEMLIEDGFQCVGSELGYEQSLYCQEKGLPVVRGGIEEVINHQKKS